MSNVETFIASLPEDSPERAYHQALWDIVSTAKPGSPNVETGFGLMLFLERHDFVCNQIDTRTHPIAGSREENALFVQHLLPSVGENALWWKCKCVGTESQPKVVESSEWWRDHFRNHPLVYAVY